MSNKVEIRCKEKIKFFEQYMQGDHVLVRFDAAYAGAQVPNFLKNAKDCVLKLSYLFQGATEYDQNEIRAYLRFGDDYHLCIIPWKSIWSMAADTGESAIWNEDVPMDVMIEAAKRQFVELSAKLLGKNKSPLATIESQTESSQDKITPEIKPKREKPKLRLVK